MPSMSLAAVIQSSVVFTVDVKHLEISRASARAVQCVLAKLANGADTCSGMDVPGALTQQLSAGLVMLQHRGVLVEKHGEVEADVYIGAKGSRFAASPLFLFLLRIFWVTLWNQQTKFWTDTRFMKEDAPSILFEPHRKR